MCMHVSIYLFTIEIWDLWDKILTHGEHLSRNKSKQETSVSGMVAYHDFAAMMKWKLKFHYEENTALDLINDFKLSFKKCIQVECGRTFICFVFF